MYMYYFLGHRLESSKILTESQKKARKRNTFLLALDGDVDFQVSYGFYTVTCDKAQLQTTNSVIMVSYVTLLFSLMQSLSWWT